MKPFALSLLALASLSASAFADIQYTTVMSMSQDGKMVPMSTTTTLLKKGLQREEMEQQIGAFKRSETTITSVAKRERVALDSSLKIYTVDALDASGNAPQPQSDIKVTAVKPSPKGTGKMVMTVGVQFLGNEKLLDTPVRHYKSSIETDSTGCCGVGHTAIKTETWMADLELPTLDFGNDSKTTNPYAGMYGSNCDVTFERKGDVAAYDAAYKGLALKSITFGADGKPMMQQQITMLSMAALGDDRFAVPTDHKKLSRADYDKKRQDAMIAGMTKSATAVHGATPADEPAANNDADKTDAPKEAPKTDSPDAGDVAEGAAKEVGKQKIRKKFKLPF